MIDISHVNVGDRVKLTRENGDEATFTVRQIDGGYLDTDHNAYALNDGDTLEIVERAFKPVPGLYSHALYDHRAVLLPDGRAYFTPVSGAWIPTDIHMESTQTYKAVRELGGWRREVTF